MTMWTGVNSALRFTGRVLWVPYSYLWFWGMRWRFKCRRVKHHNGQTIFNTFLPPYRTPAFRRLCGNLYFRRRVPNSMYIAVTHRCPCRCPHCSYGHRDRAEVPRDQLLSVIRQARELGACIIGITGGEPLLRRDLADLIASVSQDTTTMIFTTGYGLTTERAKELAQAGLAWVCIGLEAASAEEHERVRGVPGCFAWVRQAVEACHAAGLYPSVSTIGFTERIANGELERIYQLCREWGIAEFRIPIPIATGGIAGCMGQMLGERDLQALYDFHLEHNARRDDGPLVTSFAYIESKDMFGCGAGYHHLYVDAAGEVCPCDVTPLSFGNVYQRPLKEIWEEMKPLFPRPRCGCMMAEAGKHIPCAAKLPLPPQQSCGLIQPPSRSMPLPGIYRGYLKDPAKEKPN